MSEDRTDTPPPPRGPQPTFPARLLLDLNRRLSALEEGAEKSTLSVDANLKNTQRNDLNQRIYIRLFAVALSTVMIVVMLAISWHVTHFLKLSIWPGVSVFSPSGPLAIVMFVTPLLAATSITIVLVVGAFRSFRDDETYKGALGAFSEAATKSISNE